MSAFDQLKDRASKREVKLRRQREEKEGKERKLQKVRKEDFRTTGEFTLNHMHQGHLLHFERVVKVLGKKRERRRTRNFEGIKTCYYYGRT
jgi:hypothetical protein